LFTVLSSYFLSTYPNHLNFLFLVSEIISSSLHRFINYCRSSTHHFLLLHQISQYLCYLHN
jgi:hypothetical protein